MKRLSISLFLEYHGSKTRRKRKSRSLLSHLHPFHFFILFILFIFSSFSFFHGLQLLVSSGCRFTDRKDVLPLHAPSQVDCYRKVGSSFAIEYNRYRRKSSPLSLSSSFGSLSSFLKLSSLFLRKPYERRSEN